MTAKQTRPTNATIEALLAHRTIRTFTDQPIDEASMDVLLDVGRHAPTSSFYQQTTIIRIQDPKIRAVIGEASAQPYVAAPEGELLIFVVDLSRTARVREAHGADMEPVGRATVFVQGASSAPSVATLRR